MSRACSVRSAVNYIFVGRRLAGLAVAILFSAVCWAAPTDENQVIIPNRVPAKAEPVSVSPGASGTLTFLGVALLAGVGGWLLWRGRRAGVVGFNRTARQLVIEETRSLGSRQYIVVASYQDKKFLLGVCPGRIDLLAPLHDSAPNPTKAGS
jgi:flagellar protein FliO/FliZ